MRDSPPPLTTPPPAAAPATAPTADAARGRVPLWLLLAVYTGGLLLAAIFAVALGVVWRYADDRAGKVDEFLHLKAEQLAVEIGAAMTNRLRVLRAHAGRPDFQDLLGEPRSADVRVGASLDRLQAAWPELVWIGLADRRGRVLAATRDQRLGADASAETWFTEGLNGTYVAVPRRPGGPVDDERLVELAQPVTDERGQVLGVLAAALPRRFIDTLRDRIGLTSADVLRFELLLAHADGAPLGHPDPGVPARLLERAERWRGALRRPAGAPLPQLAEAPVRGEPAIAGLGWYAVAYMPEGVFDAELARLRRHAWVPGLLAALLFLPLSFLIARALGSPIAALTAALEARRAGRDAAIPVAGTIETVRLGAAVHGLLSDLAAERGALMASERRLEALVASAPDAIVSVDLQGRVRLFNRAAEAMFGVSAHSMLGAPLDRLLPQASQGLHLGLLRGFADETPRARAMGAARPIRGVRANGEEFPIEAAIYRTEDRGEVVLTAILRDVSAAYAVAAALRGSEERYRELFDRHPVPMWVFDLQTFGFLAVNDAAVRRYGWSRAEFMAMTIFDVRPPGDEQRIRQGVAQLKTDELSVSGIWTHRLRNGSLIRVEASGRQMIWEGRRARLAVLYDVTERERAFDEVLRGREQLSELSRELLEKEAGERRRLSQVLHDRFAQNLAAAKLSLESARIRGADPAALQPAMQIIEEALHEVRGLLHDLRPPLLDDFGLRAALQFEIERRGRPEGPRLRLLPGVEGAVDIRLDTAVEYGMFGIAREALANALFHAQAMAIDVEVELAPDRARVAVCDDGIGFSRDDEERARHHLGLVGMRERAGLIGAELLIDSRPGAGTRVIVTWQASPRSTS